MNSIFFGAKRVFHGGLRIMRKRFEAIAPGLTSARFDMMFALTQPRWRQKNKRVAHDLMQSELRRMLGVSAPVVARMLRSLETLGWVSRKRVPVRDRRQRWVALTHAGVRVVDEAYRRLFRWAFRVVCRTICWRNYRDYMERLEQLDTLEGLHTRLRKRCRDEARLYYAWGHPDD